MIHCPACSSEAPDGSRFCPSCGIPFETTTSAPTETSLSSEPTADVAWSDSSDRARFVPGAMLGKRYRIVGLLGRGGMGEVYRADDLKLGRPVALKFLPRAVQRDPSRLNRFLNEVKVALGVTHPNVCRVHDVGEIDGQHYLSMEYVDGEDLASLLRRIGRLPQDKAVQIARQLCAGLAAAHEEGILHRDLKPANVMIDGRGRAKIADFGLASLAERIEGEEALAGTPVYMAPEQFAGKTATTRSDIYSLGLVLYELFTGKRAFDAETPTELARLHEQSTPTDPSSLVDGFDPAVERLLLRCLEKDPDLRPASALAVAASLPGGDPLAAALAAGETPSPEVVAGAAVEGALRPWVAVAGAVLIVAGIVADYVLARDRYLLNRIPPIKPPQVLVERGRQLLAAFGYPDPPVDTAYAYYADRNYISHIEDTDDSPDRWDRLSAEQPPAALFWYRESPRLLVPADRRRQGRVGYSDPPLTVSGMANITLDGSGRLHRLRVVPPQVDEAEGPSPELDWSILFEAAGLEMASFTRVPPRWVPDHFSDARAAWEGTYPGVPEIPIRVEAGAYRGRPVFFETVDPWAKTSTMEESPRDAVERIGIWVFFAIVLGVCMGAIALARHNLRQGRGDRKSALKVALFVWITLSASRLLGASHVPDMKESGIVLTAVWDSLFPAVLVWLVYLALEPLARRWWPVTLIAWSRLLAGRCRDPMIGRDILIGGLIGVLHNVLNGLRFELRPWLGEPQSVSAYLPSDFLQGGRHVIAYLFEAPFEAVYAPIMYLFFLLLLKMILKRTWLVVVVFYLVGMTLFFVGTSQISLSAIIWALASGAVFLFLIIRLGILAFCFSSLIGDMTTNLYLDTWYSGGDIATLVLALALVGYGLWISLAGRPLLGEALLGEGK